jgi:mannan endo-1,6-alpha-mannosidase
VLTPCRLRWQVYPYLTGYNYKNSISNGCFFNIGARLARYTKNDTYAREAIKAWDWTRNVGLMNADYDIYDGAHIETNCTDINKVQFSYNMAVFTLGAANMYNYVCAPSTQVKQSPKLYQRDNN